MESEAYDEGPSKAAQEIKKTLNWLVIATVVLFLGLVGGGIYTWTVSNSNHDALCAYKKDLESRIKSSQDFLVQHPEGFAGVTVKDIQTSINSQEHAVKAFSSVHC